MTDIRTFRLAVPQAAGDELHARQDRPLWPVDAPESSATPWVQGTSLAFMRELVQDWRTRFGRRATQSALNVWPRGSPRSTVPGPTTTAIRVTR